MTLRLGDIQFLNSWPVTYALRKGIVPSDITVVSSTPADLNRRLLIGELDAGSVSSLMYLRHLEEWVPIPGLCIRSDSGVHSVLVVSHQSLSTLKGRTVGISNQGATTPVLFHILSKQRQLKVKLQVTNLRYPEILEEYPAALLIGDEALEASQSADGLQWWDLGEAWTSWTKVPFVYSLWVIRRSLIERRPELLQSLQEILSESYAWGKAHRQELMAAIRKTFPLEATFLRRYLDALSYDLDAKAWAGFVRFVKEAEGIGELPSGTVRKIQRSAVVLRRSAVEDFAGVS